MRINPEDFFDQIGATTEHQLNLKKNMAGYIDWDFDPSNYPNEWPRVILDGQGLSDRTYPCLSSYQPMPGDRVILEALGAGHVIIGAVQDIPDRKLLPGTLVFSAYSQVQQTVVASTETPVPWDVIDLDLLGSWSGEVPAVTGDESGPSSDLRARFSPPVPGWYQVSGAIGWPGNSTGTWRSANWRLNGGARFPFHSASRVPPLTVNNSMMNARTTVYEFNGVDDYIELIALHNATNNLSLITNTFAPHMEAVYLGPGSLTEPLPSIE